VALLLQQAFKAMKEPFVLSKQTGEEAREDKRKVVFEVEPMEKQPKPAVMVEGPESSKQGEISGSSRKVSYCYQCKIKGHAIEVCHATMFCDICASHDHVRPRCPKFQATKLAAVPCGYA
jgi:hypothetical protein